MQGEVMDRDSCRVGLGCRRVTVTRATGGLSVNIHGTGTAPAVSVCTISRACVRLRTDGGGMTVGERDMGGMKVAILPLCKTGMGTWEFLHVREGQLFEINGEKLLVRRYVQD